MTQTFTAVPDAVTGPSGVLSALRQDLFTGAFASRPLPPLPEAGPSSVLWRLPAGIRQGLRWTPHWLLGGGAALAFLGIAPQAVGSGPLGTLFLLGVCLLVTAPLALVLFRPVGAFWISLAAFFATSLTGGGFPGGGFGPVCHLTVMVVVVLRTRPRTAPEMCLLTLGPMAVLSALTHSAVGLSFTTLFSAVVLVAAAAGRAWREERRHVVETETVTAHERAQRTLLEERAVIARELHDVMAHHMSVIAIQAEAAPFRVKDTPPELAGAFATIRENAVASLTELRRILGLVRAEAAEGGEGDRPEAPQPTLADLDTLLAGVREAGLDVDAVVTGAPRTFPQGVEVSAYRLVQEAFSNALRHSPGARARLELSYVLGGLGLRIVNGGPEREAAPSPGSGHGLLGMRERVQLLGGEMTAGPAEDGGFEVAAFLPVAPDAPAPDTAAPDTTAPDTAYPAHGGETAKAEGNAARGEGAA